MIFRFFFLFAFMLAPFGSRSQTDSFAYRSPLDIPLVLAANFGELRPNHFHMGLDFKTNGKEGYAIHSIADGYISRVKISPYGYGKAVYINHPGGITSVYAHCSALKGKLDSLVRVIQQQEESAEIEIYFTPEDLPVCRGEIIALSGNTGGSTAPHLHFEIRNTETEAAMNPLLFGFALSDHKTPQIKQLKLYALTEKGYQIPGKTITVPVTQKQNSFSIPGNKIRIPAHFCQTTGGIGFSVDVTDYFDAAPNNCGIYSSSISSGQDTLFMQQTDEISFEHSRYVNSHKDYEAYIQKKGHFHKTFKTAGNPLKIYAKSVNNGVISIQPGDSISINYTAADFAGNTAKLNFSVIAEKGNPDTTHYFKPENWFQPDSVYNFGNDKIQFKAGSGTFYEPMKKIVSLKPPYSFGDKEQPIQQAVEVYISTNDSTNASHQLIQVFHQGKWHSLNTELCDGNLFAASMYTGTFRLITDTIAPTVVPLNFNSSTVQTKRYFTWKISEITSDINSYDLFIDGKWQLLEYEPKGNYLFCKLPAEMHGKHEFQLKTSDTAGNSSTWKQVLELN